MHACVHMLVCEVREQLSGGGFLLLPCGCQELKSSHHNWPQCPYPVSRHSSFSSPFNVLSCFLLGFWIMGWCRIKHSQTPGLVAALPRFWKSPGDWERSCGCGQWSRWRWIRSSYTNFRQRPSNTWHFPAYRGERYQLNTHVHKNYLCKNLTVRSWVSAFFSALIFRTPC